MASRAREEPVTERLALEVRGAVQGVGFRPFVYRLASELGLAGWVLNSSRGVSIEVEGERPSLESFLVRLDAERPPGSFLQSVESRFLDSVGLPEFEIRESQADADPIAIIMPDLATCEDCRREIFDPANRRHRYPFTNCTHCGPRYSIMTGLPYDRPQTTMTPFTMCQACRAEYENPLDRRFHAQPNACPACGPHLVARHPGGAPVAQREDALRSAVEVIRDGGIVALKGLGGFQLIVDAGNDAAVSRLRARKHREEKPFAVMFDALDQIRQVCAVSPLEERLLRSAEAPIVLLIRRAVDAPLIADQVAPRNPQLGAMLAYTPLHHLLLASLERPVVATSGNRSEEPICIDDAEAFERLAGIADLFLCHDREIVRPVDDSVARIVAGREQVIRRARGYAPLPVPLPGAAPGTLAVGAHLKNTIAISHREQVFISQHVGDLENVETERAFRNAISGLEDLYRATVTEVVADAHPDYVSTRFARSTGLPCTHVQHHHAHVAACMAENEIQPPVLGVSWDGTGFGLDGTIWGGEFFRVDEAAFSRVAAFRPFRLQGGDLGAREPRRAALGLLAEIAALETIAPGTFDLEQSELQLVLRALERGVNAPWTSSAGRLFDGIASLLGLRQVSRYEGQAAMELEYAAEMERQRHGEAGAGTDTDTDTDTGTDTGTGTGAYPFHLIERPRNADYPKKGDYRPGGTADHLREHETLHAPKLVLDWEPMLRALLEERERGVPTGRIALRFHRTLIEMILAVARNCRIESVVLTGGCFQNRLLTEETSLALEASGFRTYRHQRVPPNDGGIALGQIAALVFSRREEKTHVSGRAG